jgi:hypothetical protein
MAENLFQEVLEKVKARAIAAGTWNHEEKKEAPAPEKKKRKPKRKPNPRRHENFPEIHPEIFRTPGLWVVFNYLWRHSKKTKSGKLRWCGYIKDVAGDLGRSYTQTRRDFRWLEEKKIMHRWNTGKRFPINIEQGTDPRFHQTILTLCWNPADHKRQKIIEKKALKNRGRKARACTNS